MVYMYIYALKAFKRYNLQLNKMRSLTLNYKLLSISEQRLINQHSLKFFPTKSLTPKAYNDYSIYLNILR